MNKKTLLCKGCGLFDRVNPAEQDVTDWNTGRHVLEDAEERNSYRVSDWDEASAINKQRTVLFKPMLGVIDQEKLIPLRYAPLQIEFELVSNSADCVYVGPIKNDTCNANWGDFRHPMQNGSANTRLIPPKSICEPSAFRQNSSDQF